MTSEKPNTPVELLLLLVLATLWGASYTFIKIGVETIPPLTLIAARTLIAGAILICIVRWRGLHLPWDAKTWQRFLFQACLNSVIPFTLIAWAEQTTDAGLATILNSTSPIFAFLLTRLITRNESVTGRKLFGQKLTFHLQYSPPQSGRLNLGVRLHSQCSDLPPIWLSVSRV